MDWSSGSKAQYWINSEDSTFTVISCSWARCDKNPEVTFASSTNAKYPSSKGWMEVIAIHSGNSDLKLYFKKEGDKLKFVWIRPLRKKEYSGLGRRGMLYMNRWITPLVPTLFFYQSVILLKAGV